MYKNSINISSVVAMLCTVETVYSVKHPVDQEGSKAWYLSLSTDAMKTE